MVTTSSYFDSYYFLGFRTSIVEYCYSLIFGFAKRSSTRKVAATQGCFEQMRFATAEIGVPIKLASTTGGPAHFTKFV